MGVREYYSGKVNLKYKDPTLNREFKLSKLEIYTTGCFPKFAVVTFGFYFGKNNLTIPNNTENFEDFFTCDAFVDGSYFILKCLDDVQISQDYDSDYITVYMRFKSVTELDLLDLEVNSISGLSCRSENGIITIDGTCTTGKEEFEKMLADSRVVYTADIDYVKYNPIDVKHTYNLHKEEIKKEEETMINYQISFIRYEGVKKILINENEGIVTVVGEKSNPNIFYGAYKEKVVTMSKIIKGDKFNMYIGSAFALGQFIFGSKTKFNKHLQEFYGCAPQEMEQYALIDMYNRYGGRAKFEKFVDDKAKYVIKEEKKPTPKKKPKSKKDKE